MPLPLFSAASQRRNASGAINLLTVAGAARLDIGGLRFAARLGGIEEDIEHAGGSDILQLAGIALGYVEARLAELTNKLGRA